MFATPKCRFFSFFFLINTRNRDKIFYDRASDFGSYFWVVRFNVVSTRLSQHCHMLISINFSTTRTPPRNRFLIARERPTTMNSKNIFLRVLKHQRIETAKRALLINPAGASKISIYAKPELKLQIATSSWCMISQHLFYFSHILRLANEINCSKFEYSFFTPATLCWGLAGFWCLLSYVCESIFIQLSGCFCEESDITIKKETSLANQWIQN